MARARYPKAYLFDKKNLQREFQEKIRELEKKNESADAAWGDAGPPDRSDVICTVECQMKRDYQCSEDDIKEVADAERSAERTRRFGR